MGGSVTFMENKDRGNRIFVNIKLQVLSHEEKRFGSDQKLRGKRLLMIDLPESAALALSEELNTWGMQVSTVNGHDTAMQKLEELQAQSPVDAVLIYTKLNSMNGVLISRDIATSEKYGDIKQILAMSVLQSDTAEMKAYLRQYPQVSLIEKPIIRKRLYEVLLNRLVNLVEDDVEYSPAARELISAVSQPRILLVDDHRVDQMVISAMLKKMGCYVQLAVNGSEAVEILEKEKFNLVLMDYDAQEADSLQAAQKIRTMERDNHITKPIPIIAVTNGYSEENQKACVAAGMDDQIAKPIRYDELTARMQRWLD